MIFDALQDHVFIDFGTILASILGSFSVPSQRHWISSFLQPLSSENSIFEGPSLQGRVSSKCLVSVQLSVPQMSHRCPTNVPQMSHICPTYIQQMSHICPTTPSLDTHWGLTGDSLDAHWTLTGCSLEHFWLCFSNLWNSSFLQPLSSENSIFEGPSL